MTDKKDFTAKAAPMLRRYVIERDDPGVGKATAAEVAAMAATSCAAVAPLAPNLQWEHSYRTADKFFCVYLSVDEETIRKHGEMSGFPVDKITLVTSIVDPTLAA
jgi:hypothetical protein